MRMCAGYRDVSEGLGTVADACVTTHPHTFLATTATTATADAAAAAAAAAGVSSGSGGGAREYREGLCPGGADLFDAKVPS